MIRRLFAVRLIRYTVCIAVSISGCAERTPHEYKTEADERVYSIIDRKWDQSFGSQVNYKVSDTEPSLNDIRIEKAVPPSGVLGLPQTVSLATAHNRQYQTERETLYIKALDLRLVRHDFEPWFFGGAGAGYAADRNDEAFGTGANFGFDQLLAGGARISTNITAAWVDVLTGNLRSGLVSILSATVTQPLLRGSGRKIVQENLTQAERDTLYQVRLFNRFRKTFVVSIISQYYRVLQLFDTVKNAEDNYNTLANVYERTEKLAGAGRLPRFELDRARQEKLQAQDTLIQAEKEYEQALDEFKIELSLPTSVELQLDENELEALIAVPMAEPNFSQDQAIETALSQRLDLDNIADAIVDAERKVLVAADSLRAELNLIAGTDLTSNDIADLSRLKSLKDTGEISLAFDLPLDRVAEQNVYRKALITLTQRQREYEEAADTVVLEVRQAYRDLTEAAERHKVQLENLALARERFDNTLLLLRYGRASSRRVLNAQRDLFDAQNASTEALVDYTIAILNFYRDTGVLQVRPDGMWQH